MITLSKEQLERFSKPELIDMVLQLQGNSSQPTQPTQTTNIIPIKHEPTSQELAESIGMDLELLPDNKTHQFRMEIRSESSNNVYIVSQRKSNGKFECSCPAWIYTKGHSKHCKHIKAMLPALQAMENQKLLAA